MMQKLQHYERTLDEFNKKDKDAFNDMKNMKKDYGSQMKEV